MYSLVYVWYAIFGVLVIFSSICEGISGVRSILFPRNSSLFLSFFSLNSGIYSQHWKHLVSWELSWCLLGTESFHIWPLYHPSWNLHEDENFLPKWRWRDRKFSSKLNSWTFWLNFVGDVNEQLFFYLLRFWARNEKMVHLCYGFFPLTV